MRVIVARYRENVEWTNGLTNVLIYNKSDSLPNSKHPFRQLPNVGREGHTYLYHIIDNYDDLDDYTCFLQGNPFDHVPDLERRLILFQEHPISFYPLCRHLYNVDLCYDFSDQSLHPLLIKTYETIFGAKKKSHFFQFVAGAQFIVSRDTIRSRPKAFYENIMRLMDHDCNPPEGFVLERFWQMIFTHTE